MIFSSTPKLIYTICDKFSRSYERLILPCRDANAKLGYHGSTCVHQIWDDNKIKAVKDWPQPKDASEVRQFLGLASYYRCYIENFSDVAAPVSSLIQKGAAFCWNEACEEAFSSLKTKLTQAPILSYPQLDQNASLFILQAMLG